MQAGAEVARTVLGWQRNGSEIIQDNNICTVHLLAVQRTPRS